MERVACALAATFAVLSLAGAFAAAPASAVTQETGCVALNNPPTSDTDTV